MNYHQILNSEYFDNKFDTTKNTPGRENRTATGLVYASGGKSIAIVYENQRELYVLANDAKPCNSC